MTKVVECPIVLQQRHAIALQRALQRGCKALGDQEKFGQQIVRQIGDVGMVLSRTQENVPRVDRRVIQEADDVLVLQNDVRLQRA